MENTRLSGKGLDLDVLDSGTMSMKVDDKYSRRMDVYVLLTDDLKLAALDSLKRQYKKLKADGDVRPHTDETYSKLISILTDHMSNEYTWYAYISRVFSGCSIAISDRDGNYVLGGESFGLGVSDDVRDMITSAAIEESLNEKIVRKGSKWQVQSEKGRNMGTYDTKSDAENRLRQIHYFKSLKEEESDGMFDVIDVDTRLINVENEREADDEPGTVNDYTTYYYEMSPSDAELLIRETMGKDDYDSALTGEIKTMSTFSDMPEGSYVLSVTRNVETHEDGRPETHTIWYDLMRKRRDQGEDSGMWDSICVCYESDDDSIITLVGSHGFDMSRKIDSLIGNNHLGRIGMSEDLELDVMEAALPKGTRLLSRRQMDEIGRLCKSGRYAPKSFVTDFRRDFYVNIGRYRDSISEHPEVGDYIVLLLRNKMSRYDEYEIPEDWYAYYDKRTVWESPSHANSSLKPTGKSLKCTWAAVYVLNNRETGYRAINGAYLWLTEDEVKKVLSINEELDVDIIDDINTGNVKEMENSRHNGIMFEIRPLMLKQNLIDHYIESHIKPEWTDEYTDEFRKAWHHAYDGLIEGFWVLERYRHPYFDKMIWEIRAYKQGNDLNWSELAFEVSEDEASDIINDRFHGFSKSMNETAGCLREDADDMLDVISLEEPYTFDLVSSRDGSVIGKRTVLRGARKDLAYEILSGKGDTKSSGIDAYYEDPNMDFEITEYSSSAPVKRRSPTHYINFRNRTTGEMVPGFGLFGIAIDNDSYKAITEDLDLDVMWPKGVPYEEWSRYLCKESAKYCLRERTASMMVSQFQDTYCWFISYWDAAEGEWKDGELHDIPKHIEKECGKTLNGLMTFAEAYDAFTGAKINRWDRIALMLDTTMTHSDDASDDDLSPYATRVVLMRGGSADWNMGSVRGMFYEDLDFDVQEHGHKYNPKYLIIDRDDMDEFLIKDGDKPLWCVYVRASDYNGGYINNGAFDELPSGYNGMRTFDDAYELFLEYDFEPRDDTVGIMYVPECEGDLCDVVDVMQRSAYDEEGIEEDVDLDVMDGKDYVIDEYQDGIMIDFVDPGRFQEILSDTVSVPGMYDSTMKPHEPFTRVIIDRLAACLQAEDGHTFGLTVTKFKNVLRRYLDANDYDRVTGSAAWKAREADERERFGNALDEELDIDILDDRNMMLATPVKEIKPEDLVDYLFESYNVYVLPSGICGIVDGSDNPAFGSKYEKEVFDYIEENCFTITGSSTYGGYSASDVDRVSIVMPNSGATQEQKEFFRKNKWLFSGDDLQYDVRVWGGSIDELTEDLDLDVVDGACDDLLIYSNCDYNPDAEPLIRVYFGEQSAKVALDRLNEFKGSYFVDEPYCLLLSPYSNVLYVGDRDRYVEFRSLSEAEEFLDPILSKEDHDRIFGSQAYRKLISMTEDLDLDVVDKEMPEIVTDGPDISIYSMSPALANELIEISDGFPENTGIWQNELLDRNFIDDAGETVYLKVVHALHDGYPLSYIIGLGERSLENRVLCSTYAGDIDDDEIALRCARAIDSRLGFDYADRFAEYARGLAEDLDLDVQPDATLSHGDEFMKDFSISPAALQTIRDVKKSVDGDEYADNGGSWLDECIREYENDTEGFAGDCVLRLFTMGHLEYRLEFNGIVCKLAMVSKRDWDESDPDYRIAKGIEGALGLKGYTDAYLKGINMREELDWEELIQPTVVYKGMYALGDEAKRYAMEHIGELFDLRAGSRSRIPMSDDELIAAAKADMERLYYDIWLFCSDDIDGIYSHLRGKLLCGSGASFKEKGDEFKRYLDGVATDANTGDWVSRAKEQD